MGKLVNVVLTDGTVAAVPEEDAERLRGAGAGRFESGQEAATRAGGDVRAEQAGGFGSTVRAGIEGAADMFSGGLYGRAVGQFGGDEAELEMRQAAVEHPLARGIGEVGAALAPTGWLGGGARAVGEVSALGGTLQAGKAIAAATGSRALGRLAEGAMFGVQGHLAHTNVTGDPLTVEGTVEAAGVGALLNFGMGVLGDRLVQVGAKAKQLGGEAAQLKQAVAVATEGAPRLESGPVDSAWNGFRTAFTAQQKAEAQMLKEAAKAEAEAVAQSAKVARAYDAFANNNQRLTIAVKKAEQMVRDIEAGYSPLGTPTEVINGERRRVRDVLDEVAGEQRTQIASPEINKPVISPELKARLDAYQSRISDIYKKKGGGYELNGAGKWEKNPAIPPNPRGALEDLRALQDELTTGPNSFPKRSGELAELPPKPSADLPAMRPATGPIAQVRLPSTPREFAAMRPESIAKMANAMGPEAQAEFGRFARELDLAPQASAAETAAAVHEQLNTYVKAAEAVKQAVREGAEPARAGLVDWARRQLKRAAKYAVARAADVGGAAGAITRTMAGESAGYAMDRIEQSLLDTQLLAGKLAAQEKAKAVVSKYATAMGQGAGKLGPVVAYLGSTFPDGQSDAESDPRKQAVNRIAELNRAALAGPDAMFSAVETMMGHPGDIGWKIHSKVMSGVLHLQQTAPRDPGLDFRMFESGWVPGWEDTIAFAHRYEALMNPTAAIARAMSGDGHPAAADTLWAVWPAWMQQVATEMAADSDRLARLTHHQISGLSQLFRTPLSSLQDPDVVLTLQGLYLPHPPTAGGTAPRSSGRAVGRPAAVQSTVAGSSVAGLISQ